MSLKTFFHHVADTWKNFWGKEPAIEKTITTVIDGVNKVGAALGSPEADVIAAIFPNGIAGHTLAEVKALIPEALEVSTIANDAFKATEGITDPTAKANALITTTLTEVAKLPELQKEAHLLTIISSIVSKLLGISYTEATNYVTAKQHELATATSS